MRRLEVLFSPAEFSALGERDLSGTVCVVFDILRATSSMVTALQNGAEAIIPVTDIPEALKLRSMRSDLLLAGEREGVRIPAALTGSIPFDLGNSPREFTRKAIEGKTIVMTTTNGTRALRACGHAKRVLVSSFLNLQATMEALDRESSASLLLVCSGTYEEAAYEDALCAGALCDLLWEKMGDGSAADSALIARKLFRQESHDLPAAISESRNGRRLLSLAELRDDVEYCLRQDVFRSAPEMTKDGRVVLSR